MGPVLEVGQIGELGHFEVLCEVDFVRVFLSGCIQSFGSNLAVMSNSDELGF